MCIAARVATVLFGLILKLSLPEFFEIQRLDADELRKHFRLPASCAPTVAAMRVTPRGRITVVVTCIGQDRGSID
jgi:hypothetical protein